MRISQLILPFLLIQFSAWSKQATGQGGAVQAAPKRSQYDSVLVTGGVVQYRTKGNGVAVVLLSGGPGYSGDFLAPIYEHLVERARPILLDQRGTGRSFEFNDSASFTLRNAVEDIEKVREQAGADRIVLLGHSWGGALAMAYAARYPSRIAGLVLVGSAGLSNIPTTNAQISERLRARLRKIDTDSIKMLSALVGNPARGDSALRRIRLLNWKAYMYDRANVRKLAARLTPESYNPQTARWMFRDLLLSGPAVAAVYDSAGPAMLRIPVMIVYGEVDPIGGTTAAELRARFPKAVMSVIPHSGHHPWVEAPKGFYHVLDTFLRGVSP